MTDPDRLDLGALDPRLNGERWEHMVANIMERAAFELRRRAVVRVATPIDSLVAWMRPALAAAAVLALISLAALSRNEGAQMPSMFFGSAQLPVPVTTWLEEGTTPTAQEVLASIGEM